MRPRELRGEPVLFQLRAHPELPTSELPNDRRERCYRHGREARPRRGWPARRAAASSSVQRGRSSGGCGPRPPVRRRRTSGSRSRGRRGRSECRPGEPRHCLARAEPDSRALTRHSRKAETLLVEVRGASRLRWSPLPDWSRWMGQGEPPGAREVRGRPARLPEAACLEEGRSPRKPAARTLLVGVLLVSEEVALDGRSARPARQAAENLGDAG